MATTFPDVTVRRLESADAHRWIELVEENRNHLTQFGADALPPHTLEDFNRWIRDPEDLALRMGIWRDSQLIGFVEVSHLSLAYGGEHLLPQSPNGYVLGYWIGAEFTGKGYMTAACRSLMEHARTALGVTEFWSSARRENSDSMALLERLGFTRYNEGPTSVGYRLQM